jgi:transposase
VIHHVEKAAQKRRCRGCGARWKELTLSGAFERTFRALPVGRRPQFVVLHGHEQTCRRCGKTLREPIDFAQGKRRCLKALERFGVERCQFATIFHVSLLLAMGWDTVKEIYQGHLEKRLSKRKLSGVRYLAVDEFAIRKGHTYRTVVMDLEQGAILYAAEGRDAQALVPFLRRLKRSRATLEAVAIDRSQAYLHAVREVFPELAVVHDAYHVVALANKAVDETRRDLSRELEAEQRKAIKGSRFLLLRGGERLGTEPKKRLEEVMAVNEPLYTAYLLKEQLRMFWAMGEEQTAQVVLENWLAEARASGLAHFVKLAQTIEDHLSGLLAYFRHPISTGPLEGLNNKIKVLKRQAYGFRDMAYFKLRLFFIHEAIPAFPG